LERAVNSSRMDENKEWVGLRYLRMVVGVLHLEDIEVGGRCGSWGKQQ
jgi:hypothetical protein